MSNERDDVRGDTDRDATDNQVPGKGSEQSEGDVEKVMGKVEGVVNGLKAEIGKIVVGQDEVVEQLLIALFTRGHAVLVGVPGLAKTLLVSTVAKSLGLGFSRIQFTPDLMPSDITGTEVIDERRSGEGEMRRELRFIEGPVFSNVILADEVNRTPPKTQSALLEAMQEGQVTVSGVRHVLPEPFFVLATQNPIEQEGTYPLPEAQLDRFMFMIKVGYPSEAEELEIMKRTTGDGGGVVGEVVSGEDVAMLQRLVREVPISDHVMGYAVRLVRATRDEGGDGGASHKGGIEVVKRYLQWGAGPRASQNLILAGKARAVLYGRNCVGVEDIEAVAKPVLRHRLIVNFAGEAEGVNSDDVVDRLLEVVRPEGVIDGRLDRVMKSA
ncbi:ATPase family associated with various cellular activities (AAA) [Poriferisphaera corsica]|uniref:ATPase family associated with various cellular activities (AAA) n=2 Tax=Poriferisphaera corsica TaxID=2528020 RepID=A0A517YP37_9BACT|nr:AAA family ATPase [Poriferisphaera corsica]QDU31982.1 ATPase family associated with various cellular activities (AAA) [Poriferisphaera corsica]